MIIKNFVVSLTKKIILSFIIAVILLLTLSGNINLTINDFHFETIHYFIIYFILAFIYIIIEAIYFFVKNKSYKNKIDYYRQLPRSYSPSMVSYLINLKTEYKKDIMADLLFLEQRKIIKIDNNGNINITNNNPIWDKAEKHLELIYDQIKNTGNITIDDITNYTMTGSKLGDMCLNALDNKINQVLETHNSGINVSFNNFDNAEFSEVTFHYNSTNFTKNYKKLILEDLKELNLLEEYSSKKVFKLLMKIFIPIIIILLIILFVFSNDTITGKMVASFFLMFVLGGIIIIILVINKLLAKYNKLIGKEYKRSNDGKKDVSLWISYYNFLKEFSRFDSKNLEEKILWGYYFAYGLALGVNRKIINKFNLEYERDIIK